MKFTTTFSFIFILVLSSCNQEENLRTNTVCLPNAVSEYPSEPRTPTLCETEVCTNYSTIWKELIQEKNDLNQDFFDNHIKVHYSDINEWSRGTSFNICYQIQVDWAMASVCDQFIIKINPENTNYPHLDLPRDSFLTKVDIEKVLDQRAFSSSMEKINNTTEIIQLSFESALNELIEFSGVNTLCFTRLVLNKANGNLTLKAIAKYENEENLCIHGEIDLITGEKVVRDNLCYL